MKKYSVAISKNINEGLLKHLIRDDGQEDLCFALYNLSEGLERTSAIITEIIYPEKGDRNIHGNVSFNNCFFDRVTKIALEKEQGICFIHSHPSPGWQGMSNDDIDAEKMLAPRTKGISNLPLVGMTVGSDGHWSARFWMKTAPKTYVRKWCESVRVSGKNLSFWFNDSLYSDFSEYKEFERTISSWGKEKQTVFSRITVGVIGLGSVGSIIIEALQRTGIVNIKLIDFDLVEVKNLDRLQGINKNDIGRLKVDVFKELLIKNKLFDITNISAIPYSLAEEEGLLNALDCDVIFSCVDRPWPRYILDQLSYANFIPIIDGGIECSINKKGNNLDYSRWKAHTIGVDRPCLECLGQYNITDVGIEMNGDFERETYIKGLPKEHFINKGENVFGFSLGVASLEIQQFLSLLLYPRSQYHGAKEYDFNSGMIDNDFIDSCIPNCTSSHSIGKGDKINTGLISKHEVAEKSRSVALIRKKSNLNWFQKIIEKLNLFSNQPKE